MCEEKKLNTVSIRITDPEKEAVRQLAHDEQRSVSDTLHRMLFAGYGSQQLHCLLGKRRDGRSA
jgi:hypothetical protein